MYIVYVYSIYSTYNLLIKLQHILRMDVCVFVVFICIA